MLSRKYPVPVDVSLVTVSSPQHELSPTFISTVSPSETVNKHFWAALDLYEPQCSRVKVQEIGRLCLRLLTWVNSSGNALLAQHFDANTRLKTFCRCCSFARRNPEQRLGFQVSSRRQRVASTADWPWRKLEKKKDYDYLLKFNQDKARCQQKSASLWALEERPHFKIFLFIF